MPEQITQDLKPFAELARKFARSSLAEKRYENDRYPFGAFPDDAPRLAHELGFFNCTLPADCGGSGQGIDVLCVILDEISRIDASMAGIIFTTTLAQELMLAAGCRDQLRAVADRGGGWSDALIAFPSFSNPSEIETAAVAVKEEDGYLVTGSIEYLVLGSIASWALIPAATAGREGFSFFLIPLDRDGVVQSAPVASLGMHACPAVDITLDSVPAAIVGREGGGSRYFEEAADRLFIAAAAISSGIMKGAFREAWEYSGDRIQGGRAIKNWSALRMILADMAIKVEIADMAVYQACRSVMESSPKAPLLARAAALHIQELSTDLTTDGIQVLGGYGYMKDFGQEKRFRDAKQAQSFFGLVPMKKLKIVEYVQV